LALPEASVPAPPEPIPLPPVLEEELEDPPPKGIELGDGLLDLLEGFDPPVPVLEEELEDPLPEGVELVDGLLELLEGFKELPAFLLLSPDPWFLEPDVLLEGSFCPLAIVTDKATNIIILKITFFILIIVCSFKKTL
jgi:hypothetical protein